MLTQQVLGGSSPLNPLTGTRPEEGPVHQEGRTQSRAPPQWLQESRAQRSWLVFTEGIHPSRSREGEGVSGRGGRGDRVGGAGPMWKFRRRPVGTDSDQCLQQRGKGAWREGPRGPEDWSQVP